MANNLHPWWGTYIRAGAVKRGVDPAAALAVAHMEGLAGGIGDGGHAFGPFQENDAGGVLTNRPGNHRAFAESRQGVDDALDRIAKVAKGLKGDAAIQAIVNGFERPANPQKEIAGAESVYGKMSSVAPQIPADGGTTTPTGKAGGLGTTTLDSNVQTFQDEAAQIRSQARANLADIASGTTKPTDALANIPALIKTLHASIPKIDPNVYKTAQASGGDATLESQAVALARKYIGVKYTYGGTSPATGFDCSGLLQTVWKSLGVSIPRTTYDQWQAGKPVAINALKPGDAVFFRGSDPHGDLPGHVGMYIGGGKMIVAPHTGTTVQIQNVSASPDLLGARRFG